MKRKSAISLLKLLCTALALYAVLHVVDIQDVAAHIKKMDIWLLLGALAAFHASQFFATLRFSVYVAQDGIHLPLNTSLALQYAGAMLNLALPGGIGGDGYKVVVLHREYEVSIRRMIQRNVSNRISGFVWLWIAVTVLIPFSNHIHSMLPYAFAGALACFAAGIGLYLAIARRYLAEPASLLLRTSPYSLGVQTSLLLCGTLLLQSLGGTADFVDYLAIFTLGSLAAILPISVGGIGVREFVMLHASSMLGLDGEFAVAFAAVFFLLYLTVVIPGLPYFWWMKHLLPKRIQHALEPH